METESLEVWDAGQKRDRRGHRIFSKSERERLISGYADSGLTQQAYAKQEGINYTTFVGWLARRRRERTGEGSGNLDYPEMKEVSLAGFSREDRTTFEVEVALPDGTVVRGGQVDQVAALVRLIHGLGRC
jgi:transposase-like protein